MANIVRFEELVIAGILKFEKIDQLDIELFKEWLKNEFDIEVSNGRIFFNSEYIGYTLSDGKKEPWLADKYFLNPRYFFSTNISQDDVIRPLRKRLEFSRGMFLPEAFERFDSTLFVLRKIKRLPALSEDDLPKYFSKKQIKIINGLQNKGCVSYYFNDDAMGPQDAFNQLYITNLGETKLFIDDHKAEVDRFCEQLGSDIDLGLLERYLSRIDLKQSIIDMLDVKAFNSCVCKYDDSVQEEIVKAPSYKKVEKGWKTSKTSLIHELLITGNGYFIYTCHPNSLFKQKSDLSANDVSFCWTDIDFEEMKKFYPYRKFSSSELYNALGCVSHDLNGQNHCQKSTKPKYLAVVEKDLEDRYLVRGIIKSDDNGFYVLFNPLFEEYLDSIKKPDEGPSVGAKKELIH